MRIRVRLYPDRDVDLLTLKQHPGFNLANLMRKALTDYVRYGECERVRVPTDTPFRVSIQHDQIDISLAEGKYHEVIQWLVAIRPGLRNGIVKTITRSAIANPPLSACYSTSDVIIAERPKNNTTDTPAFVAKKLGADTDNSTAATAPGSMPAARGQNTSVSVPVPNIRNDIKNSADNDDTDDLWDLDFIENL